MDTFVGVTKKGTGFCAHLSDSMIEVVSDDASRDNPFEGNAICWGHFNLTKVVKRDPSMTEYRALPFCSNCLRIEALRASNRLKRLTGYTANEIADGIEAGMIALAVKNDHKVISLISRGDQIGGAAAGGA